MRIVTLCATHRGLLFLQKLIELAPTAELDVFSFREEPWEPPFLDDIQALTVASGGRFFEARSVSGEKWREYWATTPIDLLFSVSWRYLVPAEVYQRPRSGSFVFHDSLLPNYRGFSPSVWAIVNGNDHTGATLFEMVEGVDEGPIVAQKKVPITPTETIAEVLPKVTVAYLEILTETFDALVNNSAPRLDQDHRLATYTTKRIPADNQIDWRWPTPQIFNLIRAVTDPYPGAFSYLDGQLVRIWAAQLLPDFPAYVGRVPGAVVAVQPGQGSVVLTGDGALLLTSVQLEGGERNAAAHILNSLSMRLGR